MPYKENHARSILKSVTWRVLAVVITLYSIWLCTGALAVSIESTVVVSVLSTIAYYLHERVWDRLSWGRVAAPGPGRR